MTPHGSLGPITNVHHVSSVVVKLLDVPREEAFFLSAIFANYNRPGVFNFLQIKVSKPDGSPAYNESIKVTARDYSNGIYMMKSFTTSMTGEIEYSICEGLLENSSSLSVNVS
jgi:hypothetical protein